MWRTATGKRDKKLNVEFSPPDEGSLLDVLQQDSERDKKGRTLLLLLILETMSQPIHNMQISSFNYHF